MECPYCKAQNRAELRFCGNCGRQLPQQAGSGNPVSPFPSPAPAPRGNSGAIAIGASLQEGRYVITGILGQGGMGAALLAIDKRLDQKLVVMKELLSENIDPRKLREEEENFRREVITLAHLDHPLIPNVTDQFQENARFFMVQEYVEGENLEDHLEHLKRPMPEQEVLAHASEILDVLEYLARQRPPLVHRDIKPANIVIGARDKRAHLVDFGIARAEVARNSQRKQTSALGTPGYAPPEQYQGNADPRSDLYALGATMYHLLTNRDPRLSAPFAFPSARTVNSQLSPDVDAIIRKALQNDVEQRYRSATLMKRDIDALLLKHARAGEATPGYSSSGGVTGPQTRLSPTLQNPASTIVQPPSGQSGSGLQPTLPRSTQRPSTGRTLLLGILILLLMGGLIYGALQLVILPRLNGNSSPLSVVVQAPDGEEIGLSEGTHAFASNDGTLPLADVALKQQAASALNAGNTSQAESLWNQALTQQANDPEAQIYLEDQQVLAESSFHITIVVATMLTGSDTDAVGVGFDDLQGAYVAQKTYNDQALLNGIGVVLLVANAGSDSANAPIVARQIVQAAQADPTIVGVMGWPYSSYVSNTFSIFQAAHLPMVSQTASSDLLTGISPYFFRVCPTNKSEAVAGANYARTTMGVQKLIVFTDPYNAYTSSLAADFATQFQTTGGTIVQTQKYTVGDSGSILAALKTALLSKVAPDAIYFAGYSDDLSVLMTYLAQNHAWPDVQLIGGDALYQIHGYASSSAPVWNRVHFTAFAYPAAWTALGLSTRQPAFFTNYTSDFDPQSAHAQTYGWSLADNDVMLSYDATLALLNAVKDVGKTQVAASDVELALQHLNGPRAIQGVSGQIALGASGDPINKAVVFLNVSPQGQVTMGRKTVAGQFLL